MSHDDDEPTEQRERLQARSLEASLTVRDVDAIAARVKEAGATLDTEPVDIFGARAFRLRDPDGYRLVISSGRR